MVILLMINIGAVTLNGVLHDRRVLLNVTPSSQELVKAPHYLEQ